MTSMICLASKIIESFTWFAVHEAVSDTSGVHRFMQVDSPDKQAQVFLSLVDSNCGQYVGV